MKTFLLVLLLSIAAAAQQVPRKLDADQFKRVTGSASGSILVLPDFAGTIGTVSGTETLTNKTLTSPVINTATISGSTVTGGSVSGSLIRGGSVSGAAISGGSVSGAAITASDAVLTNPTTNVINYVSQPTTPATPVSGTFKTYVKASTGKLTLLTDAGSEKSIGSGSGGSGGINLLLNPDFEAGVTSDWLFSTGTLSNLSYTTPSADNLKYVQVGFSPGSSYTSVIKSVPTFMQLSDCEASAVYTNTSGSFRMEVLTSGSVVASQTLVAKTAWEQTPKIFFPCGTTTTQIRFVNIDAGILTVDDVYLGSIRSLKNGAITTAWQSYTASCGGTFTTNTTYSCKSRQVGDQKEYEVMATFSGAPNAANFSVTIPDTIDTSKITTTSNHFVDGLATINDTGVGARSGVVGYGSTTSLNVYTINTASTYGDITAVNATVPIALGITDTIIVKFTVPIVGLSGSNTTFDSRCPNDISCENVFSARITAAGVVSQENLDWINGNASVTTTGQKTITLSSGVNTVGLNCLTGTETAGAAYTSANATGITTVTTRSYVTSTNAEQANDFLIVCFKNGADFVAKRTIEGFMSKTVTSTGNFIERMERVKVATTCTASPCTITSQSGPFTTITRASTGNYTANYTAGTWSQNPNCVITPGAQSGAAGNFASYLSSPGATSFSFLISNGAVDQAFDIICMGPR